MVTLVIGGSGSGKSTYAESLLEAFEGEKYYLATMQVYDQEGHQKVEKHRRNREGKHFHTIEMPRDVAKALDVIGGAGEFKVSDGDVSTEKASDGKSFHGMRKPGLLLECMSNLAANEMFTQEEQKSAEWVSRKILSDMKVLLEHLGECVIVTNNIFEDGIEYDASTMEYLRALGLVNQGLAEMADRVIEVVVGIPVRIK